MTPLTNDPLLGSLVERHGPLELEVASDPFERLVSSIVGQQLSTASARAIRERLFAQVDVAPGPLLAADEALLRDLGLSRQNVEYVRSAARMFRENDRWPAAFAGASDENVIEELTQIHGVGVWTAKMFLMFALGRPDVFPVEDLGIRKGMNALCGALSRAEMRERAEPWRPRRSYASLYLWRAADEADAGGA